MEWITWAYDGAFAGLGHLWLLLGYAGGVLIQMVGIAAVGRALAKYVRRADRKEAAVP